MAYLFDPDLLKSEYDRRVHLFNQLVAEAIHEVDHALSKEKIKFHSITSRVKTFASICDKADGKQLSNPLVDLADIAGIRIVTLVLSDIETIVSLMKKTFDVYFVDNKLESTEPTQFGYLSVHLHAKIKNSFAGTRYDEIKEILFEIQVRTIAMDAWASASHYLDYKSEADIPSELKRDFQALSGLFYVADQHFELFFKSRMASVRKIQKTLSTEVNPLDQEINFDTVTAYLALKYKDRKKSGPNAISILTASLKKAGYATIKQLDTALEKYRHAFEVSETARKKIEGVGGGEFADVGVVRVSLYNDPVFKEADRDTNPLFQKADHSTSPPADASTSPKSPLPKRRSTRPRALIPR